MIIESNLIDGQWYWGTVGGGTCGARWDAHQGLFVYGQRASKTLLLAPAMPDRFVFAAYYQKNNPSSFAPIEAVCGPSGDWKPEQGVMLTNNLRAIYDVPDIGGL